MFKKALKIAVASGVLLAAYVGYVRLFAIVAERASRGYAAVLPLLSSDSRTLREAIALAGQAFGRGHWSAERDLPGRYYNKERGYWIFYKEYERLNDGRQFRFKPFALIWKAQGKNDLKTVTADEAVIDLDRPLGLTIKPGAPPMHVVHAQINGDVRLRDDRGTANPADDMLIGPMPYVEYDEPTLQVRSESEVVIQDPEMLVRAFGLLIQLRPKDESDPAAPGGFNGAKTAYLKKDVHIIVHDVGRSGMLPGTARAEQTADGRTPVDLRCVGEAQFDLPRPRLWSPRSVGPPAPPGPTIAWFARNVVVLRGKPNQTPDQLNCDNLKLTLLPGEKPTAVPAAPKSKAKAGTAGTGSGAVATADPPAEGGSPGGLTLRRADATGHTVWLLSESQGSKARCNELIYKKRLPEAPDETYLRGNANMKLWVEKLDLVQDGPNRGKIESITTIRTIDATIFDDGRGHDPAPIIARGPGTLETRPARDKPVERRATWQDQLVMQDEQAADAQPRKKITLTGDPQFIDPAQATLDARREIIVWLRPKPAATTANPRATAASASPARPGTGAYEIETLRAVDDVHLNAPGRFMTANNVLVAVFETMPDSAPTPAPAPAATVAPVPAPASATPVAVAEAPAPQAATKPADPDVTVRADQVWARISLRPGAGPGRANGNGPNARNGAGGAQSEVREVRLRGAVAFHQDPARGKQRGTTVTGEAVDVTNVGADKMYFKVFQVDPFKVLPLGKTRLLPGELLARIEAFGKSYPLAKVDTDEFSVEGPIIGLDQKSDEAWVDGHGVLTQMAPRGLLSDKGLDNAPAKAPAKAQAQVQAGARMIPLRIAWKQKMTFKGRSTDPRGAPVARAEFFVDVRAEMDGSLLACQKMTTYMDRVVQLNRPRDDKASRPADAPEPKPQIALVDCVEKVLVDNRKYDPDAAARTLLQRQVIESERVLYEKLTGNFLVPVAGTVYLYSREGQEGLASPSTAPAPATTANRRTITPTAYPAPRNADNPDPRRGTEVVGRRGDLVDAGSASAPARARSRAQAKARTGARTKANAPAKPAPPPLKLTQIVFSDEMHGRFGTGKDVESTEDRWADFFGDVQVLHALARDPSVTFNYDSPPWDFTFLTAQVIRVVSEPPPPGSKDPARNFLKAWDDAHAATYDTTIQADRITYDSFKELFYAYGDDGREVQIVQQKTSGQLAQVGSGNAAWFNRKTGESQVVEPRTIQLIDQKTGIRPAPFAAVDLPKKPKKPLAPFKPPSRSYFERKGFNGGQ